MTARDLVAQVGRGLTVVVRLASQTVGPRTQFAHSFDDGLAVDDHRFGIDLALGHVLERAARSSTRHEIGNRRRTSADVGLDGLVPKPLLLGGQPSLDVGQRALRLVEGGLLGVELGLRRVELLLHVGQTGIEVGDLRCRDPPPASAPPAGRRGTCCSSWSEWTYSSWAEESGADPPPPSPSWAPASVGASKHEAVTSATTPRSHQRPRR